MMLSATPSMNAKQMTAKSTKPEKKNYHHGDLHQALLLNARQMIERDGVDSLSLRKLAEQVGVSRTAAYHHFKDKNDLLIAIARQGFQEWQQLCHQFSTGQTTETNNQTKSSTGSEAFARFFQTYIEYATNNPAVYQLMFGDTLWPNTSPDETNKLTQTAHPCFQYQLELTKQWQQQGVLNPSEDALRLTQVTWATMHGITRLVIDGVYQQGASINDICQCAINLLLNKTSN